MARKYLELAGESVAEAAVMEVRGRERPIPRLISSDKHHVDRAVEIARDVNGTDVYLMLYNATWIH